MDVVHDASLNQFTGFARNPKAKFTVSSSSQSVIIETTPMNYNELQRVKKKRGVHREDDVVTERRSKKFGKIFCPQNKLHGEDKDNFWEGVHYTKKKYIKKCKTCKGVFKSPRSLRGHSACSPKTPEGYKCPHCVLILKTRDAFGQHLGMKHFRNTDYRYTCHYCHSKKFWGKQDVVKHLQESHRDKLN
jgi:hypothetical protein